MSGARRQSKTNSPGSRSSKRSSKSTKAANASPKGRRNSISSVEDDPAAALSVLESLSSPTTPQPIIEATFPEAAVRDPKVIAANERAVEEVKRFREDFAKVQTGFKASLEREGELITQVRELKAELAEKARELQEAYNAKIEDEDALANLQAELTMTAASRDAALQREDLAKELISQLQDEVSRLRSQVGDLEGTVTNLTESEPEVIRRPALMTGFTDEILGFAEWKSTNPHKYGAAESSHAHAAVTNIWAEPVHGSDRGLPPARRPRTTESSLEPSSFAGFFDVSFGLGTQGPSLPKPSTLTHSLDGKLIQTPEVGKVISPPATAMSRATSTLNRKTKRLPRI